MARRSNGQVVPRKTKRGTVYALRFYAGGERQYLTLGTAEEGWNRRKAEDELAATMAAVRAGTWEPPRPTAPVERNPVPSFHAFASQWLANREPELAPKTCAGYRRRLSLHLLPTFAEKQLDAISAEDVDAYKAAKLREGAIGPNEVNKCLGLLAQILDAAGDYGHVDPARNPARGPRRRVKGTKPRRPTIEPEQLPSLLEAAGRLRPIVATLAGAGLRNGEACALDWPAVNLASGTATTGKAKTDAGTWRQVDLPAALREELSEHKARARDPEGPVFLNRNGDRQTVSNVERRLKTAIRKANERLLRLGIEPIAENVTPHSLRRLYASLRFALGDDPVYVASQLGHVEPGFSMRVYARAVRRRERLTGSALREFDRACQWALMGTGAAAEADREPIGGEAQTPETAL